MVGKRSVPFVSPQRSESVALPALSPLGHGALRSALNYPLCRGEGCQATTFLTRSGLSPRNATSLSGHFLWVTFLLGQQKKSDSAFGRRSKRPLRKRPDRGMVRDRRTRTRAKALDPSFRWDD